MLEVGFSILHLTSFAPEIHSDCDERRLAGNSNVLDGVW
jgi:hypothetical protein